MKRFLTTMCVGLLLVSCKGKIDVGQTTDQTNPDVEINAEISGVAKSGVRRLTRAEYNASVKYLTGDDGTAGDALPEDNVDPFANNWANQLVSRAMVEGAEIAATNVAQRFIEQPSQINDIAGCTASGPGDDACFEQFIRNFGRRAFRRTLTDSEVAEFMRFHAFSVEDDRFETGIGFAVQAFLQMPDFLYIVEKGIEIDGRPNVVRLTPLEVATRLSYFLWGQSPDDALLDAAENGQLADSDQIREQAERLLSDPRSQRRILDFHAMWMGYYRFSGGDEISDAMLNETESLIQRIVFEEERDYFELFTFDESFLSPALATHYGLAAPAQPGWVSYGDSGRGGVLSHGTFLSVASKFGDTSPTQRGRVIRERFLCTKIDPPPADLNVNVDEPPEPVNGSSCKRDRYMAIVETQGCGFCHAQTDLIGLGLENYDQQGQYRTSDVDDETCVISGGGELTGTGPFNGPKELGALLVETELFETCLVKQLYQFALATEVDTTSTEVQQSLTEVRTEFSENNHNFKSLVLAIVSSESFQYRQIPEATP